ncbi:MAG: hypothetical protein N2422_03910 [Rhodobacteraceae bacterium]|nr:hypothetical protein [Paracoccaceae bacterium]
MLAKLAFTLVAVLVVLAGLARLGRGAAAPGRARRTGTVARCADCGRPVIGTTPCPCQRDGS